MYAYDGDNLIEETNSSGTVVARYSQGLNIDEPLAMLRSSTTSYYQADGLGSITSLSSGAGSLAQTYTFDSFGKQTASSGSLTNPFQYTARESDPETGLYYYRARYYDQTTGRFVSEDPIGFAAGPNFYPYAGSSPANWVDPFGLQTTTAQQPVTAPTQAPPSTPSTPRPIPDSPVPVTPGGPGFWPASGAEWAGAAALIYYEFQLGEIEWDMIQEARERNTPQPNPPPPCKQSKGKWHCTAKCHINNFGNIPNAPAFVTGEGYGNSIGEAQLAAEKDANTRVPRGTYKRHCSFKCEQQ